MRSRKVVKLYMDNVLSFKIYMHDIPVPDAAETLVTSLASCGVVAAGTTVGTLASCIPGMGGMFILPDWNSICPITFSGLLMPLITELGSFSTLTGDLHINSDKIEKVTRE